MNWRPHLKKQKNTNMPERSEKLLRLGDEADKYELPYVSKSRVMQWIKNPEHFRLKYLEGVREPETEAMVRGTRIHEAIEGFYENVTDASDLKIAVEMLPDDRQLWADFIQPYISNFLLFELRRMERAESESEYRPIGIEEEVWRDGLITDEPEWMGIADAVYHASTIPGIPDDAGVVICDFKTGSVPAEKYRTNGIYKELAYYSLVFDKKYSIGGVASYYPREDELLVMDINSQEMGRYREKVVDSAEEMIEACEEYNGDTQFETKPGPLCQWGTSEDEQSAFYGVCSQCDWGVPANNEETFTQMIEEGYSDGEVAEELGTTTDSVNYWKYKLDL